MWKRRKSERVDAADVSAASGSEPAEGREDLAALDPEFTARIDAILADVRGEADRILAEARRKAAGGAADIDEQLADRRLRLLELSDDLIARGGRILARLEEVELAREGLGHTLRALGDAADEIASAIGPEAGRGADAAAGREKAIAMAATGATRSEVEAHLREFFDLGDPTAVLDQVFGSEAPADARVPWAAGRTKRFRPG